MKSETVRLVGARQRAYAKQCIDQAKEGSVMKLGAETRRDAQNRKLWPMLADIQRQVPRFAMSTTDDIKLRFLNTLGVEMRFLDNLEEDGMFPVGLKSSTLTVEQFSGLIELIYAFGAKHGVVWSDPETRWMQEQAA
jgi:NinB protein